MTRGGVVLGLSWCSSCCFSWSRLLLCAGTCTGLLVMTRCGVMRGRVLLFFGPIVALVSCSKPALLLAFNASAAVGVVAVVAIKLFSWLCCVLFGVCVALLVTDNLSHGGRRRGGLGFRVSGQHAACSFMC